MFKTFSEEQGRDQDLPELVRSRHTWPRGQKDRSWIVSHCRKTDNSNHTRKLRK